MLLHHEARSIRPPLRTTIPPRRDCARPAVRLAKAWPAAGELRAAAHSSTHCARFPDATAPSGPLHRARPPPLRRLNSNGRRFRSIQVPAAFGPRLKRRVFARHGRAETGAFLFDSGVGRFQRCGFLHLFWPQPARGRQPLENTPRLRLKGLLGGVCRFSRTKPALLSQSLRLSGTCGKCRSALGAGGLRRFLEERMAETTSTAPAEWVYAAYCPVCGQCVAAHVSDGSPIFAEWIRRWESDGLEINRRKRTAVVRGHAIGCTLTEEFDRHGFPIQAMGEGDLFP